jgi:ribosomal protein S4
MDILTSTKVTMRESMKHFLTYFTLEKNATKKKKNKTKQNKQNKNSSISQKSLTRNEKQEKD